MNTSISLGFVLGAITMGILVAIAITVSLVGRHYHKIDRDTYGDYLGMQIVGAIAAIVLTLIGFGIMFPWKMEYHEYKPVGGKISAIQGRLLGDGKSTTQNFAVNFANDPNQTYRCDDTRCASLNVGDILNMKCIRDWQWASTPGYTCRFVSEERAAK